MRSTKTKRERERERERPHHNYLRDEEEDNDSTEDNVERVHAVLLAIAHVTDPLALVLDEQTGQESQDQRDLCE